MDALSNIIGFIVTSVLMVASWLVYLWLSNQLAKMQTSLIQEILGGVLCFALLMAIGIILYFLALPFSMGVLTISVVLMVWYTVRKSLTSPAS